MWHSRRAHFPFLCFLFEIIHRNISPYITGEVNQNAIDPLHCIEVSCQIIVMLYLSSILLALKPDGGEVFVSNFTSDTISEIATGTNEVGGAYVIGAHPARGLVSADNSILWVSNFNADSVGVYSIDDGKLINTVHVGNGPDALTRVSMIGNDMAMDSGVGTCGKEGQSVPVGVGQPTLRIDGLVVGGTA